MSDQKLERGKQWLEQLLNLSGITANVSTQQPDGSNEDEHWLTIESDSLIPLQLTSLTGPQGATIDAIQYLANASLNIHQEADLQAGYIIELDGYYPNLEPGRWIILSGERILNDVNTGVRRAIGRMRTAAARTSGAATI